MEKRFISREKKVKFVMMERKVFSKVSHERIVKLSYTFQDRNYLYMVMELCRGGELLDVIMYVKKDYTVMTTRIYVSHAQDCISVLPICIPDKNSYIFVNLSQKISKGASCPWIQK